MEIRLILQKCAPLIVLGVLGLGLPGCAANDAGAPAHSVGKPKNPPAPPAPVDVPIDKESQAAARQVLDEAAQAPEPATRAHAIEGLRRGIGEAAAPQILAALSDRDAVVRFAAAMAAGDLKLASAKAPLMADLNDPDTKVRIAIRYALHRLGDTTNSHDLERTATDIDPGTRAATADVLGRLGEPSALNILRKLRADRHPAVREVAAEALWRMGNETGLKDLVGLAASRYADDQILGYQGMSARHDTRLTEQVRTGLTSDWPEVQLAAARSLALVANRQTGPYDLGYVIATNATKSSDARQRLLAVLALGAIGRTDSQSALKPLLKDPDTDVRIAAATALLELR